MKYKWITLLALISLVLAGCSSGVKPTMIFPQATETPAPDEQVAITPFPTRPSYAPGELVDYIAQAGDTLPGLAARFNTTVTEIRAANPIIPEDATTMPPGMPMSMPIYYRALWGTPYQILPDAVFVNGPDTVPFSAAVFINQHPGWLQWYDAWAFNGTRNAAEIIDYIAINYSISPRSPAGIAGIPSRRFFTIISKFSR